jgi:predicted DsbA family dithiol-disulfide isomerase
VSGGPAGRVRVAVWSDYVCPFCYLELPVLDRLQAELGGRVEVDWRAFELRPEPAPTLDPDAPYLHRVWGRSVLPMARERGMALRLPPVQPRSRKALEAAEFARSVGRFGAMHEALFRAFFEDGEDLADVGTLVGIGERVGLDPGALRAALVDGRLLPEVLADEAEARRLGLGGVPALVVGRAGEPPEHGRLLQGAQPYEAVREAVERVAAAAGRGRLSSGAPA